jgi:type VI protein secretion system component VasK
VLRLLVSPRWLVRHVLLATALATCWGFGRWQLGRALSRHSILNWSYTVEWGLFGAFALLCWGWFLRDELRGDGDDETDGEPAQLAFLPAAEPVTEDEDPELAAYNRYLAELHARSSAHSKGRR